MSAIISVPTLRNLEKKNRETQTNNNPEASRRKEIIKSRNNEIENRKRIKTIKKAKSCCSAKKKKKIIQVDKFPARLRKTNHLTQEGDGATLQILEPLKEK